jgi:hypothetical protein
VPPPWVKMRFDLEARPRVHPSAAPSIRVATRQRSQVMNPASGEIFVRGFGSSPTRCGPREARRLRRRPGG